MSTVAPILSTFSLLALLAILSQSTLIGQRIITFFLVRIARFRLLPGPIASALASCRSAEVKESLVRCSRPNPKIFSKLLATPCFRTKKAMAVSPFAPEAVLDQLTLDDHPIIRDLASRNLATKAQVN